MSLVPTYNPSYIEMGSVNVKEQLILFILNIGIFIHDLFLSVYIYRTTILWSVYVSKSLFRSAWLVFIIHTITPLIISLTNLDIIIIQDIFTCKYNEIINLYCYAFCVLVLFIFLTFYTDNILRDAFFEYNQVFSWLLRGFGLLLTLLFMLGELFLINIYNDNTSNDPNCHIERDSEILLYTYSVAFVILNIVVLIMFARKIAQVILIFNILIIYI